jgi:hypothetical protein
VQEIADLPIGIHMRRRALPERAEQPRRGHLGRTVESGQVSQETAHRHEPSSRIARVR